METSRNYPRFVLQFIVIIWLGFSQALAIAGTSRCAAVFNDLRNQAVLSGKPIKLIHGTKIEGSSGHGGLQPDYLIDIDSLPMQEFLSGVRNRLDRKLPFWDQINQIASYSRAATPKWEYRNPDYLHLVESYRTQNLNIPLSKYLDGKCGVCRENAMLTHLALEEAGFDSYYVYGRLLEYGKYVEDHAMVVVKYNGELWTVDSRAGHYSGRRLSDLTKEGGILLTDDVAPMSQRPPYSFEPDGMQFQIANYPKVHLPVTNKSSLQYRRLTSHDLDLALSIFDHPKVREMSHDAFPKDSLQRWLNDPNQFYEAVYSQGNLIGIIHGYSYLPAVKDVPAVKDLALRDSPHWKYVGVGVHLLPDAFGNGFFLGKSAVEKIFSDSEVGVAWATAHGTNTRSNRLLRHFFGEPLVRAGQHDEFNYYFITRARYHSISSKQEK